MSSGKQLEWLTSAMHELCWNVGNLHEPTLTSHCDLQVFKELPMEFASEVPELMNLKLEGSVG